MKFQEYINSKKKLVEKPSEDMDYPDPIPERPEKSDMPKGEKGGKVSVPAPYCASKQAQDPNKKKDKGEGKGLADTGKKDKGYELPDGDENKVVKSVWNNAKTKTESWLNSTKDLSLAEFINNIKDDITITESLCEDKIGTIKEAVKIASLNENYLQGLVLEMHRSGEFEKFAEAILKYQEAFDVLGQIVKKNPLQAKWLSEAVAPSMNDDQESEDDVPNLDDSEDEENKDEKTPDMDMDQDEKDSDESEDSEDSDGDNGESDEMPSIDDKESFDDSKLKYKPVMKI